MWVFTAILMQMDLYLCNKHSLRAVDLPTNSAVPQAAISSFPGSNILVMPKSISFSCSKPGGSPPTQRMFSGCEIMMIKAGTKLKGGYGGVVHPPNLGKMPFHRANGHKKIVFAGQNIERKFKCRLQIPLFIVFKSKIKLKMSKNLIFLF